MNLFDEFFGITRQFHTDGVRYAVVGGVAMAFHDRPRFTRDIDFLVPPEEIAKVRAGLEKLGYFEASEPWTFPDTQLALHRFVKTDGEYALMVDILLGKAARHRQIVQLSIDQPSPVGPVKVARKADIIWMKRQRGSDQDIIDIRKLVDDPN